MTLAPTSLTKSLVNLALLAGREIMAIYATDFSARTKSDLTPVTAADEAAERVILEGLARLDPQTPVISEEAAACRAHSAGGTQLHLVDPSTAPRNSFPATVNSP
jgi:3'(2'), 5'-bisphosphate nucleotidase